MMAIREVKHNRFKNDELQQIFSLPPLNLLDFGFMVPLMEKAKKKAPGSWIVQTLRAQSQARLEKSSQAKKNVKGELWILPSNQMDKTKSLIQEGALSWHKEALLAQPRNLSYFHSSQGPVWILRLREKNEEAIETLEESPYSWIRDSVGGLVGHFKAHNLSQLHCHFPNLDEDEEIAAWLGLDLAAYQFRQDFFSNDYSDLPQVVLSKDQKWEVARRKEAVLRARSINLARHLTNLPPNELDPEGFEALVRSIDFGKNMEIEVWDENRLKKERMNLMLAVGAGGKSSPRMLRLRHRTSGGKDPEICFVGKGITFDSGGLDLKPSSNMRLMKKDMAGAAALMGVAYWVAGIGCLRSCDFLIALAENAVDSKSFRPGDIYTSRSGLRVEIDNTDAEGRLVLAEALTLATESFGKRSGLIVDVATLTGAGKVALGAEIASLFTNNNDLADRLFIAGHKSGDLVWRMPLYDKYFSSYLSPFADFKNSGESFGGSITAALFLKKFVGSHAWAHLDIYGWVDKAHGAFSLAGGSGQSVGCLIEFLNSIRMKGWK